MALSTQAESVDAEGRKTQVTKRPKQVSGSESSSKSIVAIQQQTMRTRGFDTAKRFIDVLGSIFAICLFSPIMLVAAILVKLQDGGPVFFKQHRVGKDGELFYCYKFRSMVLDADKLKAQMMELNEHDDDRTFKILNDPRITRVGRMLRKYSIDEFPQLWNVLLGDMSLVGPRPAVPSEVALYTEYDRCRLLVKPGLTCIWQISGRSNLDFTDQIRLDVEYITTRSIFGDIEVLAKTIPAVLRCDGAA